MSKPSPKMSDKQYRRNLVASGRGEATLLKFQDIPELKNIPFGVIAADAKDLEKLTRHIDPGHAPIDPSKIRQVRVIPTS